MSLFVNILTLIACFSAMAYCYILAKRIHAFHNVKEGVGALIEEMITTTNDLQMAFQTSQTNIDLQNNRIQDKIDEGIAMSDYLQSLLDDAQKTLEELQQLKNSNMQQSRQQTIQKNIQQSTISTLPESFQIKNITESKNADHDIDDLEDVFPADFNTLKRKKRPQIIIPGEEYL